MRRGLSACAAVRRQRGPGRTAGLRAPAVSQRSGACHRRGARGCLVVLLLSAHLASGSALRTSSPPWLPSEVPDGASENAGLPAAVWSSDLAEAIGGHEPDLYALGRLAAREIGRSAVLWNIFEACKDMAPIAAPDEVAVFFDTLTKVVRNSAAEPDLLAMVAAFVGSRDGIALIARGMLQLEATNQACTALAAIAEAGQATAEVLATVVSSLESIMLSGGDASVSEEALTAACVAARASGADARVVHQVLAMAVRTFFRWGSTSSSTTVATVVHVAAVVAGASAADPTTVSEALTFLVESGRTGLRRLFSVVESGRLSARGLRIAADSIEAVFDYYRETFQRMLRLLDTDGGSGEGDARPGVDGEMLPDRISQFVGELPEQERLMLLRLEESDALAFEVLGQAAGSVFADGPLLDRILDLIEGATDSKATRLCRIPAPMALSNIALSHAATPMHAERCFRIWNELRIGGELMVSSPVVSLQFAQDFSTSIGLTLGNIARSMAASNDLLGRVLEAAERRAANPPRHLQMGSTGEVLAVLEGIASNPIASLDVVRRVVLAAERHVGNCDPTDDECSGAVRSALFTMMRALGQRRETTRETVSVLLARALRAGETFNVHGAFLEVACPIMLGSLAEAPWLSLRAPPALHRKGLERDASLLVRDFLIEPDASQVCREAIIACAWNAVVLQNPRNTPHVHIWRGLCADDPGVRLEASRQSAMLASSLQGRSKLPDEEYMIAASCLARWPEDTSPELLGDTAFAVAKAVAVQAQRRPVRMSPGMRRLCETLTQLAARAGSAASLNASEMSASLTAACGSDAAVSA